MGREKKKEQGKKKKNTAWIKRELHLQIAQNFTYFNLRVSLELCFKTSDVLSFLQTLSI